MAEEIGARLIIGIAGAEKDLRNLERTEEKVKRSREKSSRDEDARDRRKERPGVRRGLPKKPASAATAGQSRLGFGIAAIPKAGLIALGAVGVIEATKNIAIPTIEPIVRTLVEETIGKVSKTVASRVNKEIGKKFLKAREDLDKLTRAATSFFTALQGTREVGKAVGLTGRLDGIEPSEFLNIGTALFKVNFAQQTLSRGVQFKNEQTVIESVRKALMQKIRGGKN